MRSLAAFLLLPLAFLAAADPAPEPDDNDTKKIIGTWVVVKPTKEDLAAGAKDLTGTKAVITKDTLTLSERNGGADQAIKYTLNMKTKPRGMDLTIQIAPKGGTVVPKTIPAIYRLEKDQLTICIARGENNRPRAFDEKGRTLLVMRKQKVKK